MRNCRRWVSSPKLTRVHPSLLFVVVSSQGEPRQQHGVGCVVADTLEAVTGNGVCAALPAVRRCHCVMSLRCRPKARGKCDQSYGWLLRCVCKKCGASGCSHSQPRQRAIRRYCCVMNWRRRKRQLRAVRLRLQLRAVRLATFSSAFGVLVEWSVGLGGAVNSSKCSCTGLYSSVLLLYY